MTRIFLVELRGYDPVAAQETTLKFSTHGFDAGAGVFYEPRVVNPGSLSRSISTEQLGGRQAVSWGEISLVAIDGGIDFMADWYWDGREAIVRVGYDSDPYDAFELIMRAQIAAVSVEREIVSVRLRDRAVTLERPFSAMRYAGDNALPAGLEGTPDDIAGQQKPFIGGRIALMAPVLVNASLLINQVNVRRVDAILNVFDGGVYLEREKAEYRTVAELQDENLEPGAGRFQTYYGDEGAYFRLGSQPAGVVSCAVAESWVNNSAAQLLRRIMEYVAITQPTRPSPQGPEDWHYQDLQLLDEQNAASLGVVLEDGETTASLMDRICESVGAYWGVDALGKLRVIRLDAPSATPDLELSVAEMIDAERTPAGQDPVWSVTIKHDRNYAVQDKGSVFAVVPANRAEWFANEYRKQTISNSAIQEQRLLAQEMEVTTLLNGPLAAQAEAQRRLDLLSVRRDTVTLSLADPLRYGDALDIGKTAKLFAPRLGYLTGRNMVIVGISLDWGRNMADLTLWG